MVDRIRGYVASALIVLALGVAATGQASSVDVPVCKGGGNSCDPWKRKWTPQSALPVGTIVTTDGKSFRPVRELGGLTIGQSVAAATTAFEAVGKRIIQTNEFKNDPNYKIHNLINDEGERYGNIGVCRGIISSIVIYAVNSNALMRLMRERVSRWGQPVLSFETIESSDGSEAFDHLVFTWPQVNYRIDVPTADDGKSQGGQTMSDDRPCA